MSAPRLVVLKFGSSVLRSEADLPRAAAEIKGHVDEGSRVVAVVSAIGKSTEDLIRRARVLGHELVDGVSPLAPVGDAPIGARSTSASAAPGEAALAALLATGEATSAALVGLALDNAGVSFTVLCAGRVGPFTRGPQLDAQPHAFDTGTVKRALAQRPAAVLPGFVGRDDGGHFSLLGRGGSDLTALFVAHALQADRCCLLKDVDGIYEHDPALGTRRRPRRYASLDWEGALRLEDCILQQKAAQFAFRHRVAFEVGACGSNRRTHIGAAVTRFAVPGNGETTGARGAAAPRHGLAIQGGVAS